MIVKFFYCFFYETTFTLHNITLHLEQSKVPTTTGQESPEGNTGTDLLIF
jgi:hypothetical protein